MTKKYRLKKDLPFASKGDLFLANDGMYYKNGNKLQHSGILFQHITQLDWFEEVEPERIDVRNFYHECHVVKGHEYVVEVSGLIQQDKFPAIKAAIEQVLNSTTHICKHCNAEVNTPDEDCYKAPPKPQPLFNWVVFTKEGFGFDTWAKKDWRGDFGSNWDESVKTFVTAFEADEYILMNKPTLSASDILNSWYSEEEIKNMNLAHSYGFYKKEVDRRDPLFVRLKELAKSKQQNH